VVAEFFADVPDTFAIAGTWKPAEKVGRHDLQMRLNSYKILTI
jgi:hypothetical protein